MFIIPNILRIQSLSFDNSNHNYLSEAIITIILRTNAMFRILCHLSANLSFGPTIFRSNYLSVQLSFDPIMVRSN
ncbi:hypothetical protein HanIR_Chr17g0896361 [Helianthus annuus]|nr:hypothetical protein HanIR_Chr17g0896361 [Helianthus annuus]